MIMDPRRWIISLAALLAALIVLVAAIARAQTSRPFHATSLDSLAVGHYAWTHIAVTGTVAAGYPRHEDDGDVHIKLVAPSGRFVIAECIPALPCPSPKAGQRITVYGISRRDPEHAWYEVHPVERWSPAPALSHRR